MNRVKNICVSETLIQKNRKGEDEKKSFLKHY